MFAEAILISSELLNKDPFDNLVMLDFLFSI